MPTVVLLDVSLSMAINGIVENEAKEEKYAGDAAANGLGISKKALAVHSIYKFLQYLGAQSRLEYVSLVVFSSLWECLVPFTRDYDLIKESLDNIVLYDKTCLDGAINGAKEVFQGAWGSSILAKVLIVTDGLLDASDEVQEKLSAVHSTFPCEMHTLVLSSANEFCCTSNVVNLKNAMEQFGGSVVMPDASPTFQSMDTLVQKLVDAHYKSYNGSLKCGNMQSSVLLFPPPSTYIKKDDFTYEELDFPHEINVIGFLSMASTRSPAYATRHLVLPLQEPTDGSDEGSTKVDSGHAPAFTVMLHGALRIELAVAVVRIRDDWYGMMYSWADSRKKSNLVLSVFHPGRDSVPWLGDLAALTLPNTVSFPGLDVEQASRLPVQISEKKSYSNMQPSWLRQASLQSDVQKLLRYGRKLPEKQNIFYKELNRIQKTAAALGMFQFLTGISLILERECTLLPPTAHSDASVQLNHAAMILRSDKIQDINYVIQPLTTNFRSGD